MRVQLFHLSVCLSVCLSQAGIVPYNTGLWQTDVHTNLYRYCTRMAKGRITGTTLYDSTMDSSCNDKRIYYLCSTARYWWFTVWSSRMAISTLRILFIGGRGNKGVELNGAALFWSSASVSKRRTVSLLLCRTAWCYVVIACPVSAFIGHLMNQRASISTTSDEPTVKFSTRLIHWKRISLFEAPERSGCSCS